MISSNCMCSLQHAAPRHDEFGQKLSRFEFASQSWRGQTGGEAWLRGTPEGTAALASCVLLRRVAADTLGHVCVRSTGAFPNRSVKLNGSRTALKPAGADTHGSVKGILAWRDPTRYMALILQQGPACWLCLLTQQFHSAYHVHQVQRQRCWALHHKGNEHCWPPQKHQCV